MTKEQEVAIKYLEDMKNNLKDLNKSGYVYAKENIETVLNMLKEKEKQNKELMDEYHKRVQEKIDLEQDIKVLKDDLEDKRIVYVDTPEFQDSYIPKQKIEEKLEKRKNRLIKAKRTYTNKIRMNELNLIKRILLEDK